MNIASIKGWMMLVLISFTSLQATAQCILAIDSVTHTNVVCNGQSNGSITVYSSGARGPVTYSNGAGSVIVPSEPFASSSAISNNTNTIPTNKWWSPNSCTAGSYWQYSSTLGCPASGAVFNGGSGNFAGCFLRSPQQNMNGINTVTVTFDLSNSYNASRPNDRIRFYAWVNGAYPALPITVNGTSGVTSSYYLYFNQLRNCMAMTVTLDLSSVPTNSRSDFYFYIETSCGYSNCSPYQAIVDNIEILEGSAGQSTNTFTGLPAGSYPITVTDSAGCTATPSSVVVTQPNVLSATTTGSHVTCNSLCNGTATATPAGGTGPYTYRWNTAPQQFTQTISSLCPGTYVVTVTDANNCTTTATRVVTQPNTLTASVTTAGATTIGGCNGSATANVSGGTSTYNYSWSTNPVQSTATAQNVCAGSYCVTVTDANGCTATACGTVTQPTCAVNLTLTQDSVECNGGSDGIVIASATSGMTPYQYKINGGSFQASGNFTGRAAGTYTVVVLDNLGCTDTATIAVLQPVLLGVSVSATNATTAGGTDGTATATRSGGSFPFTYSWNTSPVQTTATVTGLAAGNYCVTVTDANGCTTTACGTVNQPGCNVSLALTQDSVLCNGGTTGAIHATASNGAAPYQYRISSGSYQVSGTFNGRAAGIYTIEVLDNAGCSASNTITVLQPTTLALLVSTTAETTNGAADGTASSTISGGTPPYDYMWSNGANSQNITGLPPGQYCVTVTDANGCTISACGTVSTSSTGCNGFVLDSVNYSNNSCDNTNDGAITIYTHGGASPVLYSINNGSNFQTANSFNNLPAGSYYVQVKDANNCVVNYTSNPVIITEPAAVIPAITVSGNNLSTGTYASYEWFYNGATTGITTQTFNAAQSGNYSVEVTDANGCTGTSNVVPMVVNGIEDVTLSFTLAIYPNPFEEVLNVAVDGTKAPIKAELFDLFGRKLMEETFTGNYSLSTADLAQGVYVIRFKGGDEMTYRQVVKQ
jgi:hypothetical protein